MGSAGTCHVVPLSGLFPGTRYYYRLRTNGVVVQDTGPSGPSFTTLRQPLDPTDLFFTVIGDWGGGTTEEQQVANLQDAADPQITVTVGDDAYEFGTQTRWPSSRRRAATTACGSAAGSTCRSRSRRHSTRR